MLNWKAVLQKGTSKNIFIIIWNNKLLKMHPNGCIFNNQSKCSDLSEIEILYIIEQSCFLSTGIKSGVL